MFEQRGAAILTTSDERPAAARWRRLVTDRLDEMARLRPDAGSVSGSFWKRGRAERYAAQMRLVDDRDPFLRRLRQVTAPGATAVDAGAGTGRFALALAADVRHVTAVDPSAAMLDVLRRDAAALSLTNVSVVEASWEDADVERADVVFSSLVLALVAQGGPFVEKLEATARERVLLYLGAFSADAVLDPLWRHFHDVPRAPGATYLDALALLREIGIEPAVKVVEVPNRKRFASIEEAVENYRDWLFLPDEPAVGRELEGLLRDWLVGRPGALRSPLSKAVAAIIEWRPRARES